jgi:hypothetical protein
MCYIAWLLFMSIRRDYIYEPRPPAGILFTPQMIRVWSYGGMILTGENRRIRWRTCPSATVSTTNPTWINRGANLCYVFFLLKVGWVRPKRGCLITLAYYAFPRRYAFGERRWNDILKGENRRTRRKSCPSATLSTTNPTWIDPGVNPGLRGERSATNDLSHGMAPVM